MSCRIGANTFLMRVQCERATRLHILEHEGGKQARCRRQETEGRRDAERGHGGVTSTTERGNRGKEQETRVMSCSCSLFPSFLSGCKAPALIGSFVRSNPMRGKGNSRFARAHASPFFLLSAFYIGM